MFGRVLKYDFRSMFKQFAFIWPAALALSLVNRFTISGLGSTSQVGETTAGIAIFVYVSILIAMFVFALIFVIQRFYKGLLGDEGYLMHTLPVQPWQLIGSKLLTAVVATILSIVVALLSILLIAPWELSDLWDLLRTLPRIFRFWNEGVNQAVLFFLEALLLILTAFFVQYLHLYLAMAMGHLFNKNRIAMSIVAYVGIDLADRILLFPIVRKIVGLEKAIRFDTLSTDAVHLALLMVFLSGLIHCALYFFGTEYILRKKLNLE